MVLWDPGHTFRATASFHSNLKTHVPAPPPCSITRRSCRLRGHRCDAGEGSGGDGPVPVRTIRQELDVADGVDDGGREADEGGTQPHPEEGSFRGEQGGALG